MRLMIVRWISALLALVAACGPDYEGGGRRSELPEGTGGASGAAGTTGAGGFGLSGSSDSGGAGAGGFDADVLEDCPMDAGYIIDTGAPCAPPFDIGTRCRRDDGAECVCGSQTVAVSWDCG
jgi:hypothetical protein